MAITAGAALGGCSSFVETFPAKPDVEENDWLSVWNKATRETQLIVKTGKNEICLLNGLGEKPIKLPVKDAFNVAFSPSGKYLAVGKSSYDHPVPSFRSVVEIFDYDEKLNQDSATPRSALYGGELIGWTSDDSIICKSRNEDRSYNAHIYFPKSNKSQVIIKEKYGLDQATVTGKILVTSDSLHYLATQEDSAQCKVYTKEIPKPEDAGHNMSSAFVLRGNTLLVRIPNSGSSDHTSNLYVFPIKINEPVQKLEDIVIGAPEKVARINNDYYGNSTIDISSDGRRIVGTAKFVSGSFSPEETCGLYVCEKGRDGSWASFRIGDYKDVSDPHWLPGTDMIIFKSGSRYSAGDLMMTTPDGNPKWKIASNIRELCGIMQK